MKFHWETDGNTSDGQSVHSDVRDKQISKAVKVYYRIYSAIRRGLHLSRMTTNNLISSV